MSTQAPAETREARAERRLAELTKQRAERKEHDDLPRSLSLRELQTYAAETADVEAQIVAIREAMAERAAFSTLDLDESWAAFLKRAHKNMDDELATPAFQMPVRGQAKQRLDHLGWCLKLIHRGLAIAPAWMPIVDLSGTRIGELMREAGYETQGEALRGPNGWRGSLPEVEARIKLLTAERDKADAKLDALLVDDDERLRRDNEVAAHRAALATMRVQVNRDGNGLVARTLDDEPLPVEKMTPEQRTALEWFERASFPRETVTS